MTKRKLQLKISRLQREVGALQSALNGDPAALRNLPDEDPLTETVAKLEDCVRGQAETIEQLEDCVEKLLGHIDSLEASLANKDPESDEEPKEPGEETPPLDQEDNAVAADEANVRIADPETDATPEE